MADLLALSHIVLGIAYASVAALTVEIVREYV